MLEPRSLLSAAAGAVADVEDFPPATAGLGASAVSTSAPLPSPNDSADGLFPSDGWRSAVFNGQKFGTLDWTFRRDVATVDYQASPVPANTPRYAAPRAIMATPEWEQISSGIATLNVLGSGWDHDGTTPVAVVMNQSNSLLNIYRGADFELVRVLQLKAIGHEDLLGGAFPGYRYLVRGAVVHEGLIVFHTQRDRLEGAEWISEGVSFVTTQDLGQTLQRVPQVGGGFDVPAIAGGVADGLNRGRGWAMSNAFPEKPVDDLLGAWFPWADYLHKSGSPKGGQIGVFRARRSAVGEPWVVEPNRLVYERWETADAGGFHAHSAGMFVDGMTSFWGDVGYRNNMVRHVASDLENYTGDVWTSIEEFQGAWSPDDAKVYVLGNQAASTAPGPEFGQIITTGDLQPELIMLVERPEDLDQKAIVKGLKASFPGVRSGNTYLGRISLSVRYLRGLGYVVGESNPENVTGLTTIHYSRDGTHWASMTTAGGNAAHLYGDSFLQAFSGGLYLAEIPAEVFSTRPLAVHPGGTNLSNTDWDEWSAPGDGWSYRQIVIDSGVFRYADSGEPVEPQPQGIPPVSPSMPIWEITTDGLTDNGGIRSISGLDSDRSQTHWLTTWLYSLDGHGMESTFKFGNAGTGNQSERVGSLWYANSQWVPTFNYGVSRTAGSGMDSSLLWIYGAASAARVAPRRLLLAGEGYVQGISPTYPLEPGQSGSNEEVAVSDLQAGDEWTVALTFGLPAVSAFSAHFDSGGAGTVRPIATLLQDEDSRVDVYYTRTDRTLRVDRYAQDILNARLEFPETILDLQDKVSLVISNSQSEFAGTLQVMREGAPIQHQTIASEEAVRPNTIRFSGADGTQVTPMEWYAVQFHPTTALSASGRASLIAADSMFRVLDAGAVSADMDLDGDVDFDDIDEFVMALGDPDAYYALTTVQPDVVGDVDLDGDVDFDDIDDFIRRLNESLTLGNAGLSAASIDEEIGNISPSVTGDSLDRVLQDLAGWDDSREETLSEGTGQLDAALAGEPDWTAGVDRVTVGRKARGPREDPITTDSVASHRAPAQRPDHTPGTEEMWGRRERKNAAGFTAR